MVLRRNKIKIYKKRLKDTKQKDYVLELKKMINKRISIERFSKNYYK